MIQITVHIVYLLSILKKSLCLSLVIDRLTKKSDCQNSEKISNILQIVHIESLHIDISSCL